jgi:hypothetical protein
MGLLKSNQACHPDAKGGFKISKHCHSREGGNPAQQNIFKGAVSDHAERGKQNYILNLFQYLN